MAYNAQVHHRRSIRLRGYDYAQAGAYFVTICTHERECVFADQALRGVIEQGWRAIGRYSRGAAAGEFVVMPNHIHGIVWLTEGGAVGAQHAPASESHLAEQRRFYRGVTSAKGCAAPLRPNPRTTPGVRSRSLAALIRAFKSATTKRVNEKRRTPGAPVWQRNYYEHVVRGEGDLARIREYIRDNPLKWADDPDNPANLSAASRRNALTTG